MTQITKDWNNFDTLNLIRLIGDNSSLLHENKFLQITTDLQINGFEKSYTECKNKWEELVNTYDNYKKHGGQEPEYFSEMDKILSDLPDSSTEHTESWKEAETFELIRIIEDNNYVSDLEMNSVDTLVDIAKKLQESGQNRTIHNIKERWNTLKNHYMNYIKGEITNFKYFEVLDDILDWCPNSFNDDSVDEVKKLREKAKNWTHKECDILLNVIKNYNYSKIKRAQKHNMFHNCSVELHSEGFNRSSDQCRIKFKHMKTKYFEAIKKMSTGLNPERYCQHFDKLHGILENKNKDEEQEYEVEYLDDCKSFLDVIYVKDVKRSKNNRPIWSDKETQTLLSILNDKNVKKYSRRPFFEEVSQEMLKYGYDRSAHMCMIKWKNLRRQLSLSIKNIVKGNNELCPFYEELVEIMQKDTAETNISDQEINEIDSDGEQCSEIEKRTADDDLSEFLLPQKKSKKENDLVCDYKMDDTEHYCMSLASTFKRLSTERQAKLKIEIQKLLYAAEFDENF